jgi:hypothetical protein
MVGIAQPVKERAIGLKARVQFFSISSFSFVLFSYVLFTPLCTIFFLHSVHFVLILRILYSVLLMYFCLRIVLRSVIGHRLNCSSY